MEDIECLQLAETEFKIKKQEILQLKQMQIQSVLNQYDLFNTNIERQTTRILLLGIQNEIYSDVLSRNKKDLLINPKSSSNCSVKDEKPLYNGMDDSMSPSNFIYEDMNTIHRLILKNKKERNDSTNSDAMEVHKAILSPPFLPFLEDSVTISKSKSPFKQNMKNACNS